MTTASSVAIGLVLLVLLTFRDRIMQQIGLTSSKFYTLLLIAFGTLVFFLILFNPEFRQPPSRLLNAF